MGIEGLWPFVRKKGYEPTLRYQPTLNNSPAPGPTRRLDVLGSLYLTIRNAYWNNSLDIAHAIVEREISKLGTPANLVLYIDGAPCAEKQQTQQKRKETGDEAIKSAREGVTAMEERVANNLRVRKQHFLGVTKHLRTAFYWSPEARHAFAQYMHLRQWTVVECLTEADLRIAADCQPGDVVITKDSDLLVYGSINTIWRPISKARVLVYSVPDLLRVLNINRSQLTVLGVVSKNDYNRNIHTLGSATNFSIIKGLKGEGKLHLHICPLVLIVLTINMQVLHAYLPVSYPALSHTIHTLSHTT